MEKSKLAQVLALALVLSMSAGCSGSSSKSVKSSGGGGDMVDGGGGGDTGGGGGDGTETTAVETLVDDSGGIVKSVGTTVSALGGTVSQIDILGTGAITSGAGDIVSNTGEAVGALGDGLSDGLGSISTNDNALGTTLAGVSGAVAETGEAVSSAGTTVEGLNTLPVFAQIDESTGLLTTLGGTVDTLGITVTDTGNMLSVAFTEEGGHLSGLTTELTGVIRPLVINTDGTTQVVGQALIVGPVGSDLLNTVGGAVVVLGEDLEGDNNAVLANAGGVVTGVGQLVMDAGGLLSVDASGDGNSFDLAGLLGNNELPLLGDQLGDSTGIVATVTDTVNGLVGGNDVLGGVTDTVNEVAGGLGLLGDDGGDGDGGIIDAVDDALLDPILGGIL
jgi:hypothetical protein